MKSLIELNKIFGMIFVVYVEYLRGFLLKCVLELKMG